jgi:hypothetical protein
MNHLEAVGGSGVGEISPFHQGYRKSPQRRIPRSANPKDASTHHYQVMFFLGQ